MFEFSVQNDKGEILELTENPNYNVTQITGLTPAGCTINTAAVAGMDGETFNSARINKRNITIDVYKRQAYSDVIHIRINYFANDYMGGDASGNPDRRALLKTLQLNEDIMQGISGAVKSSFAINGVVKTQTFMSEEKAEKSIKEFERKLNNAENGILHLDAKSDYACRLYTSRCV